MAKEPKGSPWRYGYCDGILGRECHSPWEGWRNTLKIAAYTAGYLKGEEVRNERNITIKF